MTTDIDSFEPEDDFRRRSRSFVARSSELAAYASEGGRAGVDDGIPVLIEKVDVADLKRQADAAMLEALRNEIRSHVSTWLVEVLPVAVANASQQILAELESKVRNTLLSQLDTLIDDFRAGKTPPTDPSASL